MIGEGDIGIAVLIICMIIVLLVSWDNGKEATVERICTDAGYEEGRIENGVNYCVRVTEESKIMFPLSDLIRSEP